MFLFGLNRPPYPEFLLGAKLFPYPVFSLEPKLLPYPLFLFKPKLLLKSEFLFGPKLSPYATFLLKPKPLPRSIFPFGPTPIRLGKRAGIYASFLVMPLLFAKPIDPLELEYKSKAAWDKMLIFCVKSRLQYLKIFLAYL